MSISGKYVTIEQRRLRNVIWDLNQKKNRLRRRYLKLNDNYLLKSVQLRNLCIEADIKKSAMIARLARLGVTYDNTKGVYYDRKKY